MGELTVNELATFVILIGGVVGSLTVILKVLLGGLDRRIDDKLRPLNEQLKPNGGKSLRDDVAAIRVEVEGQSRAMHDATGELRKADELLAERHAENVGRFRRLERWHSALRWGLIGHLDAHRKGDTSSHVEERLEALRRIDDEYRFGTADERRPPDPAQ